MLATNLSLYWTADEGSDVREAQLTLYLEDLAEFPLDIIRGALTEWRRHTDRRKPLPGDLRALCIDAMPTPRLPGPLRGRAKGLRWADCDTDDKKRLWHAEVYATRRHVLGIYERTSPPDPQGKWFDEQLVADAERRLYGSNSNTDEAIRRAAE